MRLLPSAVATAVVAGLFAASGSAFADTINLRVIETTDIHTNVMDYDYYKNKPSQKNRLGTRRNRGQTSARRGKECVIGRQRRLNPR